MTNKEIETLEKYYLNKFYYFLKYVEDEMLRGFQTKEKIKDDWIQYWSNNGHSDFDVGAERIIYALFNGKGVGEPNSCPVGSDMFFETREAFIHIDLKTVEASGNVSDYARNIFIGNNQNSYKAELELINGEKRAYTPSLPTFYNKGKENEKICLTYFITILYEKENIDILNINLLSMPNGELVKNYHNRPLSAGKNKGKVRFDFTEVNKFETLSSKTDSIDIENSRIKIIYFNDEKCEKYRQLKFIKSLYAQQRTL